MNNKDLENLKKLSDADEDIRQINELLQDMSAFRKRANSLFEKIDNNIEYKQYIVILKTAKKMNGNLPFKELKFAIKIQVFQMLREAITLYKADIAVDEVSNIAKNTTGETGNG